MAHTMNDVAKRAGVSSATVSRVLTKNPYISAETTKRVMDAVNELQYHRNPHARRLALGKSDLFGLVISEIANPFFSEIIGGFQSRAWERGFDVLLLNTEYSRDRTQSVLRKLIENDVRGVAIMTSSFGQDSIETLTKAGIGVVVSGTAPPGRLVSSIRINYEAGLQQAIDHIASLGHRKAAVIAGPTTNRVARTIEQALVEGLRARGLGPSGVTNSAYSLDAAAESVSRMLSSGTPPTVIFCGNDLIAMGVMVALEQAGINVPQDISVLGIDDISFAFLARPPLTTIRVPREQLGEMSFKALEHMMSLKKRGGTEYILETRLIVRKSVASARTLHMRKKIDRLKTTAALERN